MRIALDDEKICIGAQPPCLERPSVATCVSAQPRGGGHSRDAARARNEPTNRASIRRSGLATTQRFDRAGSRGERPNDWVEMPGPRRAWHGERGSPRCEWAGAHTTSAEHGRWRGGRRSPPRRHSIPCLRANARVQLRAVGPICALVLAMRRL